MIDCDEGRLREAVDEFLDDVGVASGNGSLLGLPPLSFPPTVFPLSTSLPLLPATLALPLRFSFPLFGTSTSSEPLESDSGSFTGNVVGGLVRTSLATCSGTIFLLCEPEADDFGIPIVRGRCSPIVFAAVFDG